MYVPKEKIVNCFSVFFTKSKSEKCWVFLNFSSFGVFWASSDNVVDREVLTHVSYWSRFFGDEERVGQMCVTYSCSGFNDLISSF